MCNSLLPAFKYKKMEAFPLFLIPSRRIVQVALRGMEIKMYLLINYKKPKIDGNNFREHWLSILTPDIQR